MLVTVSLFSKQTRARPVMNGSPWKWYCFKPLLLFIKLLPERNKRSSGVENRPFGVHNDSLFQRRDDYVRTEETRTHCQVFDPIMCSFVQ